MSTCAACGLSGHRYGRNEGMDRFDPMACINSLRAELADPVAAVRRGVESGTIKGAQILSPAEVVIHASEVLRHQGDWLLIPVSDGGSET